LTTLSCCIRSPSLVSHSSIAAAHRYLTARTVWQSYNAAVINTLINLSFLLITQCSAFSLLRSSSVYPNLPRDSLGVMLVLWGAVLFACEEIIRAQKSAPAAQTDTVRFAFIQLIAISSAAAGSVTLTAPTLMWVSTGVWIALALVESIRYSFPVRC